MTDLLSEISYLFQRLNWLSVLDLVLVTGVVYAFLLLLRDTQIMVLLRGGHIYCHFTGTVHHLDQPASFLVVVQHHCPGIVVCNSGDFLP